MDLKKSDRSIEFKISQDIEGGLNSHLQSFIEDTLAHSDRKVEM